ncbi:type II secretion system F family protein [Tamlana sp. 2_MG-2023]|uniref:type II secretion system F family protein n=1 Tax=unclassified Tamlana TaxID=2614803 RepID=UPI0026E11A5A|nr:MULTISPECIES: type II secretion system F family protein [unclassified Tamlana]MDO6758569.1 type II secretion system F family protein [Tamlana sp. 2_MG-2023]MDO6789268.1 type II secretion system F family protein [Tamlana sp. 1_MG-2023]
MGINISSYKPENNSYRKKNNTSFFSTELSFGNRFSDKDKMELYKELSILLSSGVDFRKALEILREQQKKAKHKDLIQSILKKVVQGKSLFEALKESEKFSTYEYYSIKIGEETRKLDEILLELYQYFDRKVKMKRQLVSVFTYPGFVLLLTFGVLYFMMKFVVPMFASVFKQFGKELPNLTKKIIYISEHFSSFSLTFVLIVILAIVGHFYFKNQLFYRKHLSSFLMRLPFVGNIIRKIYITRFCQSLSLLLSAKTPLVNSLDLVQKMISFYPLEYSLQSIKKEVTKGELFSEALSKHKIYDFKLISLVSVAEQINQLDTMFERLAKQYDEELQHQTKMIGVIMEPLIIVIIGIVVGTVLIAMYSPMFDLSKIIQP